MRDCMTVAVAQYMNKYSIFGNMVVLQPRHVYIDYIFNHDQLTKAF